MADHFGRAWSFEIGPLLIESTDGSGNSNRVVFEVERDDTPVPNRAKIEVYNLSRAEMNQILTAKSVPVRMQAGYTDNYQQIFLGGMRRGYRKKDGTELVLCLSAGEGSEEIQTAKISRTFPSGTEYTNIVKALSDALKLAGISKAASDLSKISGATGGPLTLAGEAGYEMTAFLRSFGCRWFVQNGQLVILPLGGLSKSTGIKVETLLSDPELNVIKEKDAEGNKVRTTVISFTTILEPALYPGASCRLDDDDLGGDVVLKSTKIRGDTHGTTWTLEAEAVYP